MARLSRKSAPLAAVGIAIVLLAGCSAQDGSFDQSVDQDAAFSSGAVEVEEARVQDTSMAASPDLGIDGGHVITTGDATVYSTNPQSAAAEFQDYVLSIGGRLESVWVSDTQPRYAHVFAAVPSDKYEEAVAALDDFGRVLDRSSSSQDVGQQVADLDARRSALETSITRLEELMEQATTTEELLLAEDSLTARRAELDSLNSQLDWLQDQVEMSTLSVSFTDSAATTDGFSWAKAWEFLLRSFTVVAYALIVVIPWVALIAFLIWLPRFLFRRRRRRRQSARSAEN